jgi:hypothetical protein
MYMDLFLSDMFEREETMGFSVMLLLMLNELVTNIAFDYKHVSNLLK